VVLEKGP